MLSFQRKGGNTGKRKIGEQARHERRTSHGFSREGRRGEERRGEERGGEQL
jgi:hypothetical protein